MTEFDIALKKIGVLAKDFHGNESHYKSSKYSEAEVRKDFIDKFWMALGWDVDHEKQINPYEQEVKVEPRVKAEGSKRADYAFRLAPNFHDVRFFVEAKKPSIEIETQENYFQLIRYGWNSKTPLAVLTDFEQFHILDCRYKPNLETALNRFLGKYYYTDYTNRDKFSEIYWLFSREAVTDGSIEKRAKELPRPRGRAVQLGILPGGDQSIDEAFLAELDGYRNSLARNFKNQNPKLDSEPLTELAQRTLDRLVFLRFLEDKGIEAERLIEHFGEKGTAWEDFVAASRRLDIIYNGIVYKHHDILDDAKFCVDENDFADICKKLSPTNSPYDFNTIPIHILGSIYERFLGKVIIATDKRVKVEERPEVRKAGGVYYTPEYIVRYIVGNTVGKLIAGKTPNQIAEMRFADIACGSGSFLLGVFDLLLNYHGHYYNDNPEKARKGDCIKRDGKLYLSLHKKREILLNNIYGVDIDAQAYEVCQLSLYLKLLQEETEASAHQYLLDFEHIAQMKKLLPDLSKNIICGNSLIGRDVESDLFGEDIRKKLNAMDFEDAFPDVMKRGGFDAIVGNPPYIFTRERIREYEKDYYNRIYNQTQFKINTYLLFVEKGFNLLKPVGQLGFIIPNNWLTLETASQFRHFILTKTHSIIIVNSRDRVFENAHVDTSILVFGKTGQKEVTICELENGQVQTIVKKKPEIYLNFHNHIISYEVHQSGQNATLCQKISRKGILLELIAEVRNGIQAYTVGEGYPPQTEQMKKGRVYHSFKKQDSTWKKYVDGVDVGRYQLGWSKQFVKYGQNLSRPRKNSFFRGERVLIRQIPAKPPYSILSSYVDEDLVNDNNSMIVTQPKSGYKIKYIMGILNSRLISFWFIHSFGKLQRKVFPQFKVKELRIFPVRPINFSDPNDKSHHDEIVQKVEAMLETKKQLAKAQTDKDKNFYESKCASLDRQIDRIVYDLYDLTKEEIEIVELTAK